MYVTFDRKLCCDVLSSYIFQNFDTSPTNDTTLQGIKMSKMSVHF